VPLVVIFNQGEIIMNVSDLISFLQKQPQDMRVAYRIYSEQCLLDIDDIEIDELCKAREDGWIADKRPDKETEVYLVLP
jgi:hypothetical protein